jgi:hypothetical protein
MIRDGDTIRTHLLGRDGGASTDAVDALRTHLDGTERVVYRLASDGVVHEDGDRTRRPGPTALAVTDRRLLAVTVTDEGPEPVEVPYTDLKSTDVDPGLLGTGLALTVWGRGTFRFRVRSRTVDPAEAAAFANEASEAWKRAVAALQDAREHTTALSRRVEAGEIDAAEAALTRAREQFRTARHRAGAAPDPVVDAIEERVQSVERDLARTRAEARLERARHLGETVETRVAAGDYDAACRALERARRHLDTALDVATDREFAVTVREEQASLDRHQETLATRPLERAARALDRAQARADRPAVAAWVHAFECYRDALTAGWGTDVAFDGDTDALRLQVEWLAAEVVRRRRRLAARYESEGDRFRTARWTATRRRLPTWWRPTAWPRSSWRATARPSANASPGSRRN